MAAAGDGLHRLAQRAERMAEEWPRLAAIEAERVLTAELRGATGDGGLSRGRDLGRATVEVEARPGRASVTAGGSRSVWTIIESGTRAHRIEAAPGRFLRTPAGPRRAVSHPGSSGKRTWTNGAARAMPQVERSAEEAFREVIG